MATVLAPFLRSSAASSTSVNSNTPDANASGSSCTVIGDASDGTRNYIDVDDALYSFLTPKLLPKLISSKTSATSNNSNSISIYQGDNQGISVSVSATPQTCGTSAHPSAPLDPDVRSSAISSSNTVTTSAVASARPAASVNYESTDWFSRGGDLGQLLEGADALNWDEDPGEAANLDEPETDILLLGEKA